MFWRLPSSVMTPVVGLVCAICTGIIAHYCGRRFWPSFVAGFFLGPLAVLFALIFFVPKRWRHIRW